MLRRTLRLRIVVADEKPELRRFAFDPVEEATRDRHELLTAAFTVLLAWLRVRGLPENKAHRKPLGSFEEWADLVAGAVSWLTGTNPVDLIEESKDQDAGAADDRRVIEALAGWQQGLRDERGSPRRDWAAKEAAAGLETELWGAVLEVKGDKPTNRQVGNWLARRKDAVFGNWMLTGRLDRNGVARWAVRGLRGSAGSDLGSRARNGETAKSSAGGGNGPRQTPQTPRSEPDEPSE